MTTRRDLFKAMAVGALAAPLQGIAGTASAETCTSRTPTWGRGIEGQRKADLGDGSYLNPIIAADHPDPTILKDGDDYYMTFSSFLSYPGLVLWHSTDLVNWAPVGPALHTHLGDIWAVDLCKHGDRYFLYIPANPSGDGWSIFVIWTDDIRGPWSEPVDLEIRGCIDPGHVVGEDGKRYLFVNGIRKIRLRDDGLATDGELQDAYQPWRYPAHWITENFAPEGPKLLWRDGWLYLVTAVGGTAGPATGHMVIAARSRSVHGPWEHCPRNPLVRTLSADEPGGRVATPRCWKARPATGGWSITATRMAFAHWAGRPCWNPSSGPMTAGSARWVVICRSRCASPPVGRVVPPALRCRAASRPNASARSGAFTNPARTKANASRAMAMR